MYKTIVVHVDNGPQLPHRTAVAARLAEEFGAHLIGSAATGASRDDFLAPEGTEMLPPPDEDYARLVARARTTLAPFADQMRKRGMASWEERVAEDTERGALLAASRCADLLVLSHEAPSTRLLRPAGLPEYLALHCPRPVLIVPDDHGSENIGTTALVGWDGSMEASRAIAAALPLLRRAQRVIVAIVNGPVVAAGRGEQSGDDLAPYLARHGIVVEVLLENSAVGAGQALLDLAGRQGVDLLVAGAYGHSRYREWIAGGATRTLLNRIPLPLLVAH